MYLNLQRIFTSLAITLYLGVGCPSCTNGHAATSPSTHPPDINPELATFIAQVKSVDNHTHVNTIDPNDEGADALPLHLLFPFDVPARLRPDSPDWLDAYQALYGFIGTQLDEETIQGLSGKIETVMREKGAHFPEWVLDQIGTEVMLANRVTMGPGLAAPRFRWVSYVDALLFPLSTKGEAMTSPDREILFPVVDMHLASYLKTQGLQKLPVTLEGYLSQVVTATLEAQKQEGCLGVKFEVGFLRSFDFDNVSLAQAAEVYARYVRGGEPGHDDYKALQDFLFHYIAKEAGRLSMAVHIHAFPGPGKFYSASETRPILLESVFKHPDLQETTFVLIHAGGPFTNEVSALLWNPNVYADISALTRFWTPTRLASVLRDWLSQFPEKVLFGTDAASFGPGLGWELGAWIATKTGREALAIALSEMLNTHDLSIDRAKEIATMVLRGNASELYQLGLDQ